MLGSLAIASARSWSGSHPSEHAAYPHSELVLVDLDFDKNASRFAAEAADAFVALRHVKLDRPPAEAAFDYGLLASQGTVVIFANAPQLAELDLAKHAAFHSDPANLDKELRDGTMISVRRSRAIAARGESLSLLGVKETSSAGYPARTMAADPLRVVMIYGQFSSAMRGKFDLSGLYDRVGLTGSEGSFFNLARSLAEAGHEVLVVCDAKEPHEHESGASMMPIDALGGIASELEGVDAVLAWNEPDYLHFAPKGALRICDQQLNDFAYCRPGFENLVDFWVSPSKNHQANVMQLVPGSPKIAVIPNSVDLDLFAGESIARDPHRAIWCSSPDRGLHLLLDFWPMVRKAQPRASLRIFYRLKPWLDVVRSLDSDVGRRARFIEAALARLGPESGVEVCDAVPNTRMARELQGAAVLLYPCDPVRYTEGFGCSVLDAAAAGCLPIIHPADALGEVHGSAAFQIPNLDREEWSATAARHLSGAPVEGYLLDGMKAHAVAHDRHAIAEQWVDLIRSLRH